MKKSKLIKKIDKRFLLGIAHRGLHDEVSTENGLDAFKKAIDKNTAFELDVHLSKDGKLIVCHDDNLVRTTSKEGVIEELTLKEIKENYRLLDGEEVPTLQEVLSLNDERVPLVIELKTYKNNNKALAKALQNELKDIKDKSKFFIISFDPRSLYHFGRKGIMRGLLITHEHEWVFKLRHLFESLDVEDRLTHLEKYRRYQKKHFVNVWTIEDKDNLASVKDYVDTITYQYMEPDFIKKELTR